MGRPRLPLEQLKVNVTITVPFDLARIAANRVGCPDNQNRTAVRDGIMEILEEESLRVRGCIVTCTSLPEQPIVGGAGING